MTGRDRLRELLDAVLDEENRSLAAMADGAFASPYHFARTLSRDAGEAPVAMRRRVMLERAAWQLRTGSTVTDAAWAAGYSSVEGFSRAFARAFGHPPSAVTERPGPPSGPGHWLPAPNGIHFHPPTSLWVHAEEQQMNPLTEQLVEHDLDDTRDLLVLAKGLPDADLRAVRLPENTVTSWEGAEESIHDVLEHHIFTKEIWMAAIEGTDHPDRDSDAGAVALLARHDAVAPRWLATVRDIERRGAWDDRLIDALCDPPESFVLSSVVAHVLTYAAHRRQLARHLLGTAGVDAGDGDPINWLRARRDEEGDSQ
ncbi:helix-turn-helix domain-containing protein [Nocardioides sp. BGMRC 2183]|nr:helix-turn-helix domain-containing protein [Nocardioides sp. BGMRC 2183]